MKNTEKPYLHALNRVPGIGPQKLRLLLAAFGSYAAAWNASAAELGQTALPKKLITAITDATIQYDVMQQWNALQVEDIDLLLHDDADFPESLRTLPQPPLFLYVRGNHTLLNEPTVAIVGSRKYSPYGKQVATRCALDLADAGIHVVSGLALGIDAIAHRGVLDTRSNGKTIAVLGGSIDDASITPRTHVALAHKILEHGGCLISEYAPPTTPSKGTFPARNRIMAGLTQATLVVEAAHGSGTLITAQYATQYDRPLFAVPGSIFAHEAVGTNTLIAKGQARLIQTADDILHALHLRTTLCKKPEVVAPIDGDEKVIFLFLKEHVSGCSIDAIIRGTSLPGATVTSTLVLMELDGFVKDMGGGHFVAM